YYLDFAGYGSYAPYDEDNNPTDFNASEQANITETWRQMSIYLGMFNMDVTTEMPPPNVPKGWAIISNSISGGYAYVGTFPATQPEAFNEASDAQTRISGIAHEAGHQIALQHQSDYDLLGNKTAEYSSGYDSLHGPIMGVDFAQNVHKWWIGHPSYSASALQDDLAEMASRVAPYSGGDGFRPDDFGNTIATASPLAVNSSVHGIIERLTDQDAFSFVSAGGVYSFSVVPDNPSALDAKLEIYDSTGALVAAKDSATNDQQLTMILPAGTFTAIVSSHGNYGDVGVYDFSVRSLPADWNTQDIGSVLRGGYAGFDGATGTFSLGGSGTGITGTSDEFRFAYEQLTGDGSITARVTGINCAYAGARSGIMIRESLNGNSKMAFVGLTASGGADLFYRNSAGGATSGIVGGGAVPYWVRLTRTGNSILAERSSDGVMWTTIGSPSITMASAVYIGLAVTSAQDG